MLNKKFFLLLVALLVATPAVAWIHGKPAGGGACPIFSLACSSPFIAVLR